MTHQPCPEHQNATRAAHWCSRPPSLASGAGLGWCGHPFTGSRSSASSPSQRLGVRARGRCRAGCERVPLHIQTRHSQRSAPLTPPHLVPSSGGGHCGLTHELHFVNFARAARARRKWRIGESAGAAPRGRPRAAQTRLLSGRAPAQRRVAGRGRRRRGGGGGRCMWPRGVLRIQNPELSG